MKTYSVLIKRNDYYTVITFQAKDDSEALSLANREGEVIYHFNPVTGSRIYFLDVIEEQSNSSNDEHYEQMLDYYPEVIKGIREFQHLIETQSLQVDEISENLNLMLENAFIDTAHSDRIEMWEQFLGITPPQQGEEDFETWLSIRKETILARLYSPEKLNTKAIEDIVAIFTKKTDGKYSSAISYFKDSVIHVLISPPEGDKSFKFDIVEQELRNKIPAHLELVVKRNYYTWEDIKTNHSTWNDVKTEFSNWNEALFELPI